MQLQVFVVAQTDVIQKQNIVFNTTVTVSVTVYIYSTHSIQYLDVHSVATSLHNMSILRVHSFPYKVQNILN